MSDENEGGDVIHLPPRSDPDDVLTLPGRTYTGTSESQSDSPVETTWELPVIFPERTAVEDLAESRPAETIPPPPSRIPHTFRSEGSDEPGETTAPAPHGGPALAAAAVMAAALAALRGMAGWLSDRRARRQTEAEEAAPLREARQKARLSQEEAAADHALAIRKMRDKSTQQRERSRVPSGQEWGQKASNRGSGGGKNGPGGTGAKSSGKGSSGAHKGSGKNGATGSGSGKNGAGSKGSGTGGGRKDGDRLKKSGGGGTSSSDGRRQKPKPPSKERPKKSSGGSSGSGTSARRDKPKQGDGGGKGSGGGRDKPPKKPSGAGLSLNKAKADRERHQRKNGRTPPTDLNGKQDGGKSNGGKDRREKPKAPKQGAAETSPWREAFRNAKRYRAGKDRTRTTSGVRDRHQRRNSPEDGTGDSPKGSRTTGPHNSRARTDHEHPRRPWEDPDRRERSKARSDRQYRKRQERWEREQSKERRRREDARTQRGRREEWAAGTGAFRDGSAWEDVRGATGPIPAADAGITVERVRPHGKPRRKPEKRPRPAAIDRAPRALPRAPESGTRRPGTQKPGPQSPPQKGPRMTRTSRLSAHHATEMNLDEYLVTMTNIAHAAAAGKEDARTIAQTMMRIAKALEIISEDIAGAHNLGPEVVDEVDSMTEDSEEMKARALEMTKRLSAAADLSFTAAVEVGKDYRQDKDAKDDAGLAHASAAAHHTDD